MAWRGQYASHPLTIAAYTGPYRQAGRDPNPTDAEAVLASVPAR